MKFKPYFGFQVVTSWLRNLLLRYLDHNKPISLGFQTWWLSNWLLRYTDHKTHSFYWLSGPDFFFQFSFCFFPFFFAKKCILKVHKPSGLQTMSYWLRNLHLRCTNYDTNYISAFRLCIVGGIIYLRYANHERKMRRAHYQC